MCGFMIGVQQIVSQEALVGQLVIVTFLFFVFFTIDTFFYEGLKS